MNNSNKFPTNVYILEIKKLNPKIDSALSKTYIALMDLVCLCASYMRTQDTLSFLK